MYLKAFLLSVILLAGTATSAVPDGKDLLRACEVALRNDFRDIEGGMCRYYVTPCDCDFGKQVDTPRVCLPENVSTSLLAQKVVTELKAEPSFYAMSAADAAAAILSQDYPCSD